MRSSTENIPYHTEQFHARHGHGYLGRLPHGNPASDLAAPDHVSRGFFGSAGRRRLSLLAAGACIAGRNGHGRYPAFYWRAQTPKEQLAAKRITLIWKHIAFLLIYGGGTVLAWYFVYGEW
jgi:hypothetical protein